MMDRIGKYEILERVGSGGFAVVYKGYDPWIKRPVAIKVCHSREEETRQRFYREAEIAGRLVHRNITTVYDFGLEGETPYLVEELLTGQDLAHLIQRHRPAELGEKLDILLQIASGLEYAHAQGVVHRDIKPANVRVLEGGWIKIMDFGTAKLLDVESRLTGIGMTLGTVAYLAPERLVGRPSGLNSDIFSYGVLAYELLAFERPFAGDNVPSLIEAIVQEKPRAVADRSSWPDDLAKVVERCLEKDPAVRYASCTELIVDLERVRDEHADTRTTTPATGDEDLEVPEPPGAALRLSALYHRAEELASEGKRERARLLLDEVLELEPTHDDARALLNNLVELTPTETESPELRRRRKIHEAVASVESYLASGHLVQAGEALAFAVRLFGVFERSTVLRHRMVALLRTQLSEARRRGQEVAGHFVEQMADLRRRGRLTLAEAERIAAQVERLDSANRGAEVVVEALRVPPPDRWATRPLDLRSQQRAEAVVSIEKMLDEGEARMAQQALQFAIRLFGNFEEVPAIESRIRQALANDGEG